VLELAIVSSDILLDLLRDPHLSPGKNGDTEIRPQGSAVHGEAVNPLDGFVAGHDLKQVGRHAHLLEKLTQHGVVGIDAGMDGLGQPAKVDITAVEELAENSA
jgi:hypothetical protein